MKIKQMAERGIDERLVRAAVKQSGGMQSFLEDMHNIVNHGVNGGFHGWIYYSETVKFAEKHKAHILELAEEMASDFGTGVFEMIAGFNCLGKGYTASSVARAIYERDHEDHTQVMNALAWFACEEVARAAYDIATEEK